MSRVAYFQLRRLAGWLPALVVTLGLACTTMERPRAKPAATGAPSSPSPQTATAAADRGVFDVVAYGANGQDDLDDTLAVQRAIDAAVREPGSVVQVPAGTYYLADRAPEDSVSLRIDGARRLTFSGAGIDATVFVLRSERDAHMIALSSCHDVSVSGFTLDGRREGRKDTHGLRVADSSDVRLTTLRIHSTAHYGIGLQQGTLQRIWIEHVWIDDTGGDGIDFKNTENDNRDLVIRDVHISRPGQTADKQTGVDIRGPAQLDDVFVSGVRSGATGIRFREDGPDTGLGGHHSRLSRFKVEGDAGSSGVAIAADDVSIDSGVVVGTDTGVVMLGKSARVKDVAVRGARYAFRVTTEARDSRLVSCSGDSGRAGVWLEGANAIVQSSSFAHNRVCGVCVRPSATALQLLSNHFEDNGVSVDDEGASTNIIPP
ncbi:MAG: glycosyl hydrolase family 28-related protein [Myxococcales bacterium]